MGNYESQQGVDPVRIETFRRMRKQWKFGELQDAPGSTTTSSPTRTATCVVADAGDDRRRARG